MSVRYGRPSSLMYASRTAAFSPETAAGAVRTNTAAAMTAAANRRYNITTRIRIDRSVPVISFTAEDGAAQYTYETAPPEKTIFSFTLLFDLN